MTLDFDFVLRLLVAGILGAIIGLDREYRAKEAGYRTHFLVSLGSALIMIVSKRLAGPESCSSPGSQRYRFYRCRYHHITKTNCQGADYCCRNMGYSRHRSGGWSRNVCNKYSCYPAHSGWIGTAQHPVQKCRDEKLHDNILYRK